MQFEYNLKKAIELQLSHQKGMILQNYEGADLNECITQAILKADKVFLRYFLDLCNTGTEEELEEFLNTTTEKNLVKECTMIFMRYVDPEGFLKALMYLRQKEMLEKKESSI